LQLNNNMSFEKEKNKIIDTLDQYFVRGSVTYSWEINKSFGSLYYNFLKISSNYKLNDGSIASRKTILSKDLRNKNPIPIYEKHVLVEVCKESKMFSLKNHDESNRAFKNWRFQILKSDL